MNKINDSVDDVCRSKGGVHAETSEASKREKSGSQILWLAKLLLGYGLLRLCGYLLEQKANEYEQETRKLEQKLHEMEQRGHGVKSVPSRSKSKFPERLSTFGR